MGKWHSRHLQLQIIHPAFDQTLRGFNSNKINRDRTDQGSVPTHRRLQGRRHLLVHIHNVRNMFGVARPDIVGDWRAGTAGTSLRVPVPCLGVGVGRVVGPRVVQPSAAFVRLRR